MKRSKKFSLNWRDVLNGLLMAASGSVASYIFDVVNSGSWELSSAGMIKSAIIGISTYLGKNYFTDNKAGLHPDKPSLN